MHANIYSCLCVIAFTHNRLHTQTWYTLLTHRSPEFSEPPERLQLFSRIREWQFKDAGRMVKHVEVRFWGGKYGALFVYLTLFEACRGGVLGKYTELIYIYIYVYLYTIFEVGF